MHAKKLDKLATAVLYTIAGIIVAILASLILYILVRGLPHISWSFLTGKSSSYQAGGGIGIQLYNSFFLFGHYLDHFCSAIYGSWCFPR